MMERLAVWFKDSLAGTLEYDGKTNSFVFAYSSDYLSSPKALALSVKLPLREEAYDAYETKKFFENMLPPEVVRRKLEVVLGISAGNVFGCLKVLGRDCAGAISIFPEGESPNVEPRNEKVLTLTEAEEEAAIRSLRERPLLVGFHEGFRMSATGAQDKIVARVRDGRLALPLYGAASTDIVKPAASRLPESVFNEMFCQRLASCCGIDAAECDIVRFGNETCYRTIRFDRYVKDGIVRRHHQEDFCQALGIEAERKYQDEGGPSVRGCLLAMRKMRLGFAEQRKFIEHIAFTYLIGNADAHGKNHAILYRNGQAILAPLYDAMCTAVYETATTHMAMRIGSAVTFEDVRRTSFGEMADACDIGRKFAFDILDRCATSVGDKAKALAEELSDTVGSSPIYKQIIKVIDNQRHRVK